MRQGRRDNGPSRCRSWGWGEGRLRQTDSQSSLPARKCPRKTRGIDDIVHRFKEDVDACLQTRNLAKVFSMVTGAVCVQDQDQDQDQSGQGSGSGRRGKVEVKTVETVSSRRTFGQRLLDKNEALDQDRHAWAAYLVESINAGGGDAPAKEEEVCPRETVTMMEGCREGETRQYQ